ncbi:bifunctional enoyl-CoA hydratase/phosphate acetyltransferase [Methylocella silvestris]|uniref:Phosphate acetyltransferase n=1 Tax=Methylocella silvestris TaxID=199596 RepID=A0A2J7TKT8_METSI|nr:bifunctional enoyl-CoA hydratase/phosphate acetyltransferase [Methylocella silvestris]PNG27383.1 phosphate acetyltransferase [Methylocella silvestris]
MKYPHLDQLIKTAEDIGPAQVAVAFPCSVIALESAITAKARGLIEPVLIGPLHRIRAIADANRIDLTNVKLMESGDDPLEAASAAVLLCHEKAVTLIMKGSLHTDELLSAVVNKSGGLRTSRRISHTFLFDMPSYPKPLLIADCVVNINPTLSDKRDIIQNTIDLAFNLGVHRPHVGVLSAVETVNMAIQSTLDAAALSKMSDRGQITGAVVDGPLAFDVAISSDAAETKGVSSPVSGNADILLMPNLEAGNMLYKQLIYLTSAQCAGIVIGTRAPIILTSRADSALTRVASCALAVIHAHREREKGTMFH